MKLLNFCVRLVCGLSLDILLEDRIHMQEDIDRFVEEREEMMKYIAKLEKK